MTEEMVSAFFYAILASVDYEVAIQFPNDTCITPALDTSNRSRRQVTHSAGGVQAYSS